MNHKYKMMIMTTDMLHCFKKLNQTIIIIIIILMKHKVIIVIQAEAQILLVLSQ